MHVRFPFTRLLGYVALVTSTFDRLILRGFDVMTMSMKELQVGGFTIAPLGLGDDVVEFHQVLSMFEIQSTPRASSVLPFEQDGPLARRFRMSAQSACPVDPIAIIRATPARDFRIPTDCSGAVLSQLHAVGRFECPLTLSGVPVFFTDPPRRFVRMTTMCPSTQVRVECLIHADEGLFRGHRCIVVAPSVDDGIEPFNEDFLRSASQASHFLMHLSDVSLLACFGGPDQGFEAQWFALSGGAGFGLTHRVLPNLETEEIKPCGAIHRVERMPDPRFTGLQG